LRAHDPAVLTLAEYEALVRKQAAALETLGAPLGEGGVEILLQKAQLVQAVSEKPEIESKVKYFKRQYALEVLDVEEGQGVPYRLAALRELLFEYSVDVDALASIVQSAGQEAVPRLSLGMQAPLGPVPQWPLHTPGGAGGRDKPIEDLARRLQDTEVRLAAQELHRVHAANGDQQNRLIEVLETQGKVLTAISEKRPPKNSTIRIEPRITWPKLGDEGGAGDEVEKFYKKVEGIFNLVNDGNGMPDRERLVTLESCLQGSRLLFYKNIMKRRATEGKDLEGSEAATRRIRRLDYKAA